MQRRFFKKISRISLLAAVVCVAVPGHLVSQKTPNTGQTGAPPSGNPFKWLLSPLTKAAKPLVTQAAGDVGINGLKPGKEQKDIFGIVSAIITLLITTIPMLLKTYEGLSLRSKAKDLDRIQDLVVLMEKTKKEKVLEGATLDAICAQIDQEILYALDSLERTREQRKQVLQKRQEAMARKKAKQDPELTYISSSFLIFRPHGPSAWLAHAVAFLCAFLALWTGVLVFRDPEERGVWLAMTIMSLGACLLARMWALWERRQWKTARQTGRRMRTMFFVPRNLRTVVAQVFAYWWLFLLAVSALSCISGDTEFWIVLIPSLPLFWLGRKWVLYERKRWERKHPVSTVESAAAISLMEKAEPAALPATPG
jgi:hypothetical protein